jgi:hypothetical protein
VFADQETTGSKVRAGADRLFWLQSIRVFMGIVIGVFSNFRHSHLNPFRHEGNSRY